MNFGMRLSSLIILLLVSTFLAHAECPHIDCGLNSKQSCTIGEDGCPTYAKSKRQELIDKCDYFTNQALTRTCDGNDEICLYYSVSERLQLAEIYCTRALLEDDK